jgi:hypothetical protein
MFRLRGAVLANEQVKLRFHINRHGPVEKKLQPCTSKNAQTTLVNRNKSPSRENPSLAQMILNWDYLSAGCRSAAQARRATPAAAIFETEVHWTTWKNEI